MRGMDPSAEGPARPAVIGIAGRPLTDQEKSYVKQAMFLLRFRLRQGGVHEAALPISGSE